MQDNLAKMRESGDFAELSSMDEYTAYFHHLARAFTFLVLWYKNKIDGGSTDEKLLTGFLSRLLHTVSMLRLKHLFDSHHKLHVDLNESGFPHSLAIMQLGADLMSKADSIKALTPQNMLTERMLDVMIERKEEPTDLLWERAQLEYFNSISEDKLMLMFTEGELVFVAERPEYRKYLYSWACYDFATNMPFLHFMAFDQDKTEEPLENYGTSYERFMSVVKEEGSRAPSVLVLASSIDEALEPIHPKFLKRVRLGPIISPRYVSGQRSGDPMIGFLKKYGDPDDFAMRILTEVIISKSQRETTERKFLSRVRKIREIFAIPTDDLRSLEHQAFRVFDHLLLPHHVLQQVVGDQEFAATYGGMSTITYTKEGDLHVV